jgi:RHS repeat-associated protein
VKTSATFDNADQLTSITHQKGTTTLANFNYTRDNLGQLTSSTSTGVPDGPESYSYTRLNQLASLNSKPYGYDHANNLTKLADGTTQSFDAANQLISSTPPASGPSSPTVDQVVSGDQKKASTKITSPAVKTTSRNQLVLAFVSADGPKGSAQKVAKVTGGGLTWSLAVRANDGRGTAEVWQAYATVPVSTTVTATLGNGQFDGSITVATFTGAARTVGATAGRTAQRASAPSITLKTTKAGSLVWAAGHDWDHAATITPLTGQDLVHQFRDTRVDRTYWAQRTTEAIPTSGKAVTIGDTAPTTDRWELAAVEIPPDPDATASSSGISYTYDKQGNRTGITPAAGTSTTLSYDQANRLTTYGPSATYTYNGDGLRMSKTVNGATTAFVWDQSQQLPLLLVDGSEYYIYGDNDQPIERISDTVVTYLHRDQQGSTRLLTDSTGSVAGTYTYDPYGRTVDHTGQAVTPFQYAGQYTDAESSYQYLQARFYDPSTGQFLTRDPIFPLTMEAYTYAANNPLNKVDPSGLAWWNPTSWTKPTWDNIATGIGFIGLGLGIGAVAATAVAAAPVAAVLAGGALIAAGTVGAIHLGQSAVECFDNGWGSLDCGKSITHSNIQTGLAATSALLLGPVKGLAGVAARLGSYALRRWVLEPWSAHTLDWLLPTPCP